MIISLGINEYRLTCGVERTLVELNILRAVGPDVVCICTVLVERTAVEGLGRTVEEYLTVEGTVVVNQVTGMLETGVVYVGIVIEGYVVEGNACITHVLRADVIKYNTVNRTGDDDVLTGNGERISACKTDLHFVSRLCSCECFVEGGVHRTVDFCYVDDNLIIYCDCSIGDLGRAVSCEVGLVGRNDTCGTIDELVAASNDRCTVGVQRFLIGSAKILEGVVRQGDLISRIGLDQAVCILTADHISAGDGKFAVVEPDCVFVRGVCVDLTIGKLAIAAETDTVLKRNVFKLGVDEVLIHELVSGGEICTLVSEGQILHGNTLDVGNAAADNGQLSACISALDGYVIAQCNDAVGITGFQSNCAINIIGNKICAVDSSLRHCSVHGCVGLACTDLVGLEDRYTVAACFVNCNIAVCIIDVAAISGDQGSLRICQHDLTVVGERACDLYSTCIFQSTLSGYQEALGGLEGGGLIDAHITDRLVAKTHTVMVVDNQLGAVDQIQGSGCVYAGFGLGSGTTADGEAVLYGQGGIVKRHSALVDQVIQLNGGVLDLESAVVLVISVLFTTGYVDTGGSLVGSGGQVRIFEDDRAVAYTAAADEQEALAPINGSSTGDGYGLSKYSAVHSDGSIALGPKQSNGVAILCRSESCCEGLIISVADLCNSYELNFVNGDRAAYHISILEEAFNSTVYNSRVGNRYGCGNSV